MKKNKQFFCLVLIAICFYMFSSYSVIYVITTAYNQPDYIELQYKTFKKFLKDNYEYIVFNDAPNPDHKSAIENRCKSLGIRCFNVPQEIHKCDYPRDLAAYLNNHAHTFTPAWRHGDSIHYALETLGFDHNDIVVIIDSDVFLVKEFNIREFLGENHIASMLRTRAKPIPSITVSPDPELTFFAMPKLPHKKAMIVKAGLLSYTFFDPFWFLQFYIYCHPELKLKNMRTELLGNLNKLSQRELEDMGFSKFQAELIPSYDNSSMNVRSVFFERAFITCGRGSTNNKKDFIVNFVNKCLLTKSN